MQQTLHYATCCRPQSAYASSKAGKQLVLQCLVYACQIEPSLPEADLVALTQQLLEMGNDFHGEQHSSFCSHVSQHSMVPGVQTTSSRSHLHIPYVQRNHAIMAADCHALLQGPILHDTSVFAASTCMTPGLCDPV